MNKRSAVPASRIRNIFLYGGLTPDQYQHVHKRVRERNQQVFRVLCIMSIELMVVMFIGSFFFPTLAYNRLLYFCYGILAAVSLLLMMKARNTSFVTVACYLDLIIAFSYGFFLSFVTRADADVPAVTFVVLMIVLPLMMTDVLWRMSILILSSGSFFLFLSHLFNSPGTYGINVTNILSMTLVGIVLYAINSAQNYRRIAMEIQLQHNHEAEKERSQNFINSLADIIESRDQDTGDHVHRTSAAVHDLMAYFKSHADQKDEQNRPYFDQLTPIFCETVTDAACLHDIGKIRISDTILNKPRKLTDEEFAIMKQHTVYGGEIVNKILSGLHAPYYQNIAYNIARYHHERWDGNGYPDGLKGTEIPLEARLMSLVDVYDALTHDRCYKKAYPKEKALQIIQEGLGTQFDPVLGRAFLQEKREDQN